jgi:membrane protein
MPAAIDSLKAVFERRVAPAPAFRAAQRFLAHQMTDRAATLSYYGMLSLFPGLLVAISLIGLIGGEDLVRSVVDFAEEREVSGGSLEVVETVARRATDISGGSFSLALILSLVLALNAASGIFNAAGRAVDAAFEVEDDRSFVSKRLTVYGVTGFVLFLLLLTLLLLLVGGSLARNLVDLIGIGDGALGAWNLARWPAALLLALVAVAVVMRFAPTEAARRRRLVTTGALVTVGGWVLATLGFSFYVTNFASYGALYGAFSAAIVLLLWLYLLAIAFLYGAELDAVLAARRREAPSAPAAQDG